MDTHYTLIELYGGAHIELEVDGDTNIAVDVAGTGTDERAGFYLTEAQALELIAELSVKVAQGRAARAAA